MKATVEKKKDNSQKKQIMLWIGALVVGAVLGMLGLSALNDLMNFIATVYTRLFQLLAVPTIALAVMTTLAALGNQADTGRIFKHTIVYTLLTTTAVASVGLVLYNIIQPGNLPQAMVQSGSAALPEGLGETSYYDHILGVIPNNIVKPFSEGNVLSILMLAAAVGIAIAKMPGSDKKDVIMKGLQRRTQWLFLGSEKRRVNNRTDAVAVSHWRPMATQRTWRSLLGWYIIIINKIFAYASDTLCHNRFEHPCLSWIATPDLRPSADGGGGDLQVV